MSKLLSVLSICILSMLPVLQSCQRPEAGEDSLEVFSQKYESGQAMLSRQSFEAAMSDALSALEASEALKVDSLKAKALCLVASIDLSSGDDERAWEYATQAEQISQSANLPKYLARALHIKGRVCSYAEISEDFNRNDEAIELLTRAYDLAKAEGLREELARACFSLGDVYVSKNRWNKVLDPLWRDKAGQMLNEGEAILRQAYSPELAQAGINAWMRYYRQGGEYQKCLDYCLEALEYCEPTNYQTISRLYDHIFTMHTALDQFEQMYLAHQKYVYYSELLQQQKTDEILLDMQTKYQTQQKERIIERNRLQLMILVLAMAFLVVAISLVVRLLGISRKRNSELSESNATKDKFLTIISHDLKNPALAQRNALKGLVDFGGTLDQASLSAYHKELLKESESHVNLILNMLDWARMQAGKITLSQSPVSLSDIVSDQIRTVSASAKEKDITLVSTVPSDVIVSADRNMVSTVVRNLLTNAVKFTPNGGRIEVSSETSGDTVSCSVRDNGMGMSPEQMDTLFDILHPKSSRGTKGETGTGLGLTVCREFIERNGGTLSVESTKAEGSTFTFTLKKA